MSVDVEWSDAVPQGVEHIAGGVEFGHGGGPGHEYHANMDRHVGLTRARASLLEKMRRKHCRFIKWPVREGKHFLGSVTLTPVSEEKGGIYKMRPAAQISDTRMERGYG
jgi:hypothetical protein